MLKEDAATPPTFSIVLLNVIDFPGSVQVGNSVKPVTVRSGNNEVSSEHSNSYGAGYLV